MGSSRSWAAAETDRETAWNCYSTGDSLALDCYASLFCVGDGRWMHNRFYFNRGSIRAREAIFLGVCGPHPHLVCPRSIPNLIPLNENENQERCVPLLGRSVFERRVHHKEPATLIDPLVATAALVCDRLVAEGWCRVTWNSRRRVSVKKENPVRIRSNPSEDSREISSELLAGISEDGRR